MEFEQLVTLSGRLRTARPDALRALVSQFFPADDPTLEGEAEQQWVTTPDGAWDVFIRGLEPAGQEARGTDVPWARAWVTACPDLAGRITVRWPYVELQETEAFPFDLEFLAGRIFRTPYVFVLDASARCPVEPHTPGDSPSREVSS